MMMKVWTTRRKSDGTKIIISLKNKDKGCWESCVFLWMIEFFFFFAWPKFWCFLFVFCEARFSFENSQCKVVTLGWNLLSQVKSEVALHVTCFFTLVFVGANGLINRCTRIEVWSVVIFYSRCFLCGTIKFCKILVISLCFDPFFLN